MELKNIQAIKQRINSKLERGDFVILSNILEVPQNTARARYRRNNEKAVIIIREIVTARNKLLEKLIEKYRE